MTLTEQWKKGELPEGFYYVTDGAEVTIDYYLCDYWERHFNSDVQQVLAPVPSYQEYLESESHCAVYSEVNKSLKEKNQQLNERLLDMIDLLQKCYFYLNAVADGKVKTEHFEQIKTLAVLIDNAIGEK